MPTIIKSTDCPNESHPAGAIIFEEGASSSCFYIIQSGTIDVFKNHGKPDELKLASIPAGRVVGEIGCLDGGVRTATAIAQTAVELVAVSAETITWQLKQCPQWFGSIVLDLVERLRTTDAMLPKLMSGAHPRDLTSMKATHSE